ncbi:sensor histidine kinase [Desulfogranum marinum]|uniref:sensor histidine kinase n=1 Tax=Desulfogranum marinum TaxID=453220 RepID=UPI001965FDA6|nr:ATP-binding protein [Desulfogranum marinum]MBM9513571.1 hypothetical protein [Desulfogranum marinum]
MLTFIAMLIANGLVVLFWYNDAITREMQCLEQKITHASSYYDGARGFESLIDTIGEQSGAECLYINRDAQAKWLISSDKCTARLETVIQQSGASGTTVRHVGSMLNPFWSRLYLAFNVTAEDDTPLFIALSMPLRRIFDDLWQKEKIVLSCLVVNALIFAMLFFYRFSKWYLRPMDRLVELADTYKADNDFAFLGATSQGEFGQLSRSMHSMLAKIETDRQALRQSLKELEQVNRELKEGRREMVQAEKLAVTGRLAAGLAHEIGNPLGIIGGYMELMKKNDIQCEERLEYLCRSEEELSRLHGLVQKLVDCGRPSVICKELFHAHPIVTDVVNTLRYGKAVREINFTVSYKAANDKVEAEVDGLKQVLLNCVLNAVDAVQERYGNDGGHIAIRTRNRTLGEKDFWVLQIDDNGCGIPAAQQDSIFDPFYTTKAPGRGTGLGLTVSRSIVEVVGGKLILNKTSSQGTTMEVLLPLAGINENVLSGCQRSSVTTS